MCEELTLQIIQCVQNVSTIARSEPGKRKGYGNGAGPNASGAKMNEVFL
jgi:hypothetical protein